MTAEMRIGVPRLERSATGSRVTALVGDTDVWFESDDATLLPSAEGFGSAFLIPALAHGRRMVLGGQVAADWASYLDAVVRISRSWWHYPNLLPVVATLPPLDAPARSPQTGLGFTGGVDSFFSLLAAGRRVDVLIFVHGFDVALDDGERAGAVREQVEAVARAHGARVVVVRTNLRSHPDLHDVHWGRTHGGALAAIGHLLSGEIGCLMISSSYSGKNLRPWGSHPDLDPLWSSGALAIDHVGEPFERYDKLRSIANEPLAQKYLRVCWENRDTRLNCSRCGKCVRTRLMLASLGALESFQTLDGTDSLASSIDGLHARAPEPSRFIYDWALAHGLPPEVDRAVRRLLRRNMIERGVGPLRRALQLPLRVVRFGCRRVRRPFAARARTRPAGG